MTTDTPIANSASPSISIQDRKVTLLDFCRTAIKINGSDIHLQSGSVPMIRVDGKPKFLDLPTLPDAWMDEYVADVINAQQTPQEKRDILEHKGAVDVAFPMPDKSARFRTNIFHSRERYAIVMRRIVTKIPNMTDLNLPPQVEQLGEAQRGIIIVSGTTGSGKSTTLASVIGKINRTRSERIITVEDPVEYQHENVKSVVSQVEVGTDSESYEYALRAMMRQDPDVILIGEIRDSFSLSTALGVAADIRPPGLPPPFTLYINASWMTIERMVSLFLPDQKELQQTQLALNLVAVLTQRLAKRRDGKGRIPVVELMVATPLVRKYILDGEFEKLKSCVGNRESGSQSFDQHLTELFTKQIIDVSEAKRLATNVDALNLALRGISNSDSKLR